MVDAVFYEDLQARCDLDWDTLLQALALASLDCACNDQGSGLRCKELRSQAKELLRRKHVVAIQDFDWELDPDSRSPGKVEFEIPRTMVKKLVWQETWFGTRTSREFGRLLVCDSRITKEHGGWFAWEFSPGIQVEIERASSALAEGSITFDEARRRAFTNRLYDRDATREAIVEVRGYTPRYRADPAAARYKQQAEAKYRTYYEQYRAQGMLDVYREELNQIQEANVHYLEIVVSVSLLGFRVRDEDGAVLYTTHTDALDPVILELRVIEAELDEVPAPEVVTNP